MLILIMVAVAMAGYDGYTEWQTGIDRTVYKQDKFVNKPQFPMQLFTRVLFPRRFSRRPQVLLMHEEIEFAKNRDVQYQTFVSDVTINGFYINYLLQGPATIPIIKVRWVAMVDSEAEVLYVNYSFEDLIRLRAGYGTRFQDFMLEYNLKFPAPRVTAFIVGVDMELRDSMSTTLQIQLGKATGTSIPVRFLTRDRCHVNGIRVAYLITSDYSTLVGNIGASDNHFNAYTNTENRMKLRVQRFEREVPIIFNYETHQNILAQGIQGFDVHTKAGQFYLKVGGEYIDVKESLYHVAYGTRGDTVTFSMDQPCLRIHEYQNLMQEEQPELKKVHPKAEVELHHQSIPYLPSAISYLRCNIENQNIAVGRLNGVIEIFNSPTFISLGVYVSISSRIRCIIWSSNEQFIAFYMSGQIALFKLDSPKPVSIMQLPDLINVFDACAFTDKFIVSCSDGALRALEVDNDRIILIQQTLQMESAAISITTNQQQIYASFQNGFIRSYNNKLQVQHSFTLNTNKSDIIPWKVQLHKQYLLIGTSNGLFVYETKFNTQVQQLDTHMADILSILSFNDHVFVSGVDSKVVQLSYNNGKFQICGQQRGQSHDVYTLDILNDKKLLSGGVSTDICVYNIENGLLTTDMHHIYQTPTPEHFKLNDMLAINHFDSIDLIKNGLFMAELKLASPAHFIQLNESYLAYGQSDQTLLLRIDKDNSLQKIRTLPAFKQMVFQNKEFYSVDKDDKLYHYNLNGQGKFIAQLPSGYIQQMVFLDKKTLLITQVHKQRFITIKNNNIYEVDCSLNNNMVTNIQPIRGNTLQILVTYASQALAIYIQDTEQHTWKIGKYSREYMFQSPLSYKTLREPIKGVVTDQRDDKRLLLYTSNHLVRAHMRGRPPRESTEVAYNPDLHLDLNFSTVKMQNILAIRHQSENTYVMLLWDKEASFAGLPAAFNAKKYKQ